MTTVAEYLATSYRPECELIDGEIVERNTGDYEHSSAMAAVVGQLARRRREWNIHVLIALRMQVSATRFRAPDICAVSRDQAPEPVLTRPPLVCIEILAEADRFRAMRDRIEDFLSFGVPDIWIIDPARHDAWVCTRSGMHRPAGGVLKATTSGVEIHLADLFAQLD